MNKLKYLAIGMLIGAFALPFQWIGEPVQLAIGQTVTVDSTQSPLVVNAAADLADLTPTDGQSVIIKTGAEKGLWYYDKDSSTATSVSVLNGPGSVGRFLVINNDAGSVAAATAITAAEITDDGLLELQAFDGSTAKSLTLEELKKTGVQVVNVLQYGATGDGVADDKAELELAIAASNGKPVTIPAGVIIRLASAITVAESVTFIGEGTILVDFAGTGITITAGDFTANGVTFDGNSVAIGAVKVDDADNVKISGCVFTDFDSDTYVQAVTIVDSTFVLIEKSTFSNLTALANTTQGDTNGAIRAIYISGNVTHGEVKGCLFQNINNRTAGDVLAWEDADAIQCAPLSGKVQDISFVKNTFTNCGKRALKLSGLATSVYSVTNNTISSGWTGTTDTVGATGNGMINDIECYGGRLSIIGNRHIAGVTGAFVVFSTSLMQEITVSDNIFVPEYHEYVVGSRTRFIQGATLSADCIVNVTCNTSLNTYYALDGLGSHATIVANNITSYGSPTNAIGANPVVVGNFFLKDASSGSTTSNAIVIDDGVVSFTITGNTCRDWQDGINITAQTATFRGTVTGNNCYGCTRRSVTDSNAGTAYESCSVLVGNTTDNTANNVHRENQSQYNWWIGTTKYATLLTTGLQFNLRGYTATQIADATSSVNTTMKAAGSVVFDTTNNRIMVSTGATTTSAWYVADGSASVTPS